MGRKRGRELEREKRKVGRSNARESTLVEESWRCQLTSVSLGSSIQLARGTHHDGHAAMASCESSQHCAGIGT